MPRYDYKCDECGYKTEVEHSADLDAIFYCTACGAAMRRSITEMPAVNWGGLKPSVGEIHPDIAKMVDEDNRRRREEQYRIRHGDS